MAGLAAEQQPSGICEHPVGRLILGTWPVARLAAVLASLRHFDRPFCRDLLWGGMAGKVVGSCFGLYRHGGSLETAEIGS